MVEICIIVFSDYFLKFENMLEICQNAGTQECKNVRTSERKNAGTQERRNAGMVLLLQI